MNPLSLVLLEGDPPLTLGNAIEGWASHVSRLQFEASLEELPFNYWGAHDFLAALHLRSFVEQGLTHPTVKSALAEGDMMLKVKTVDSEFLKFTSFDSDKIVLKFAEQLPESNYWWWHRMPSFGPIHDELLEWRDRIEQEYGSF